MAYDPTKLTPVDTTSLPWALATLRLILSDREAPERYSDAELEVALDLASYTPDVDGATHYRPHVTAAGLIRSDPERAIQESIDNASETRRDPGAVASGILRSWGSIDDRIEAATGYRPSTHFFRPVF